MSQFVPHVSTVRVLTNGWNDLSSRRLEKLKTLDSVMDLESTLEGPHMPLSVSNIIFDLNQLSITIFSSDFPNNILWFEMTPIEISFL